MFVLLMPLEAESVVNAPVLGVVAPTGVLLIDPPVIVGAFPKAGSTAAPAEISICPAVPGAAKPTAPVPSPIRTLCALRAFCPVPPLATPTGVVAVNVVKAPVFGVVAPTGVLLIEPVVIATPDIVPEVACTADTVGFG